VRVASQVLLLAAALLTACSAVPSATASAPGLPCKCEAVHFTGKMPVFDGPTQVRTAGVVPDALTLKNDDVVRIYVERADNGLVILQRQGHVLPAPGDDLNWTYRESISTDFDPKLSLAFEPRLVQSGRTTVRLRFTDKGVQYHYLFFVYVNGSLFKAYNFVGPSDSAHTEWNYVLFVTTT
jgi:hypothetical protein